MGVWVGLVGGLAFVTGPGWRLLGEYVLTMVHEAGHAAVSLILGGQRVQVRVRFDGTGATDSYDEPRAQPAIVLAGYFTPPLVGLGVLALLRARHPALALGVVLGLLALLLLLMRSVFGALITFAAGAGVYLAARYATPAVQVWVAATLAWLLLAGSVRDTMGLLRDPGREESDARTMADLTWLPLGVWSAGFLTWSLAAVGGAGWLLLGF